MSSDTSHKIPNANVFIPTPEDRDTVIRLLQANVDTNSIASVLDISPKQLLDNFPTELRAGSVDMIVEISKAMYDQALDGHFPSQKFMLECLGGWQTKTDKERVGDKAHPLQVFMYNPEHPDPELDHTNAEDVGELDGDAVLDPSMESPTL